MMGRKASHAQGALDKKFRKSSTVFQPTTDRIFIGIAGGSGAGKTTLCTSIQRIALDRKFKVQIVSLDCFYKDIDKTQVNIAQYDFDHPYALDFQLAYQVLHKLLYSNDPVDIPQYSFVQHKRMKQTKTVYPADIILFEGLMTLHQKKIRNMMTYKIFINCDDDIRLARRLLRDTTQRGRTIEGVLTQYNKFVKNAFRNFIYPTICHADLIIPGTQNGVSVGFIVQNIKNMTKRINIFNNALETKVFLFGQNQYYQKPKKKYQISINAKRQPFLVFPISHEHCKQLKFFINYLLTDCFQKQYLQDVYINQFLKIIKSQLKQVIKMQKMNVKDMQLISIYQIRQKLLKNSLKPIKLFFIPLIFDNQQDLLNKIKAAVLQKQKTIIINIFCDPFTPKKIVNSQIQGITFINLFLIPKKNKLLDILLSHNRTLDKNNKNSQQYKDSLINNKSLTDKAIQSIIQQFNIQYHKMDWKLCDQLMKQSLTKFKQIKQQSIIDRYQEKNDQEKLIWTNQRKRQIKQILVLPQTHPNLSGFHALHNIKECSNLLDMRSKQKFFFNYMEFCILIDHKKNQSLKNLQKQLFLPLQRNDLTHVIHDKQLFNNKQIVQFFLSQGNDSIIDVISNQQNHLLKLWQKLKSLKSTNQLYLLMRVFTHYFILKLSGFTSSLSNRKIQFLDSNNTPIQQIMTSSLPNPIETTRKNITMKIAIQITMQLFYQNIDIPTLKLRAIINQILSSYSQYKSKNQLKKWLDNTHYNKLIHNQLFPSLSKITQQNLGQYYMKKIKTWYLEQFIQENIIKNKYENLLIFKTMLKQT